MDSLLSIYLSIYEEIRITKHVWIYHLHFTHVFRVAQSAGAAEYTDYISAKE